MIFSHFKENSDQFLTITSLECFISEPLLCNELNNGAWVAQLVEHMTENHGVGGSIPPPGTTFCIWANTAQLVEQLCGSTPHIGSQEYYPSKNKIIINWKPEVLSCH